MFRIATWTSLLIACGACAAFETAAPAPADERITGSLRAWFTTLARDRPGTDADTPSAGSRARDAALAFDLAPGGPLAPEALSAWIEALRTTHPRVEYRLAELTVSRLDEGVYEARFALERRAIDASGLDHVALSDQSWRIREGPDRIPIVTAVASTPRLVFPGTGPQIICY